MNCKGCKHPFEPKRPAQRFCSKSCVLLGQAGENNRNWKGGRRVHKQSGRMTVYRNGRYELEHRVITNAPSDMVVHHIDGDKTNNSPSNLQLMSRGEHVRLHNYLSPRRNHRRDGLGRFAPK